MQYIVSRQGQITNFRRQRKTSGATLFLVVASSFLVLLVGVCVFWLVSLFGGNHELDSATDAGTLAAAHSINSICLQDNEATDATIIPSAFVYYGVDSSGNFPIGFNTQGQPINAANQVITKFYYNSNAYNMCAWVTLLACMRAAKDNSPTAIAAANNLCVCLSKFSITLAADIQRSAILSNNFATIANNNSTDEMPGHFFGQHPQVNLQHMRLGCYVPQKQPSTNIYLPNNVVSQFPQAWLNIIESGAQSNNGLPLLRGGQPIFVSSFSNALQGAITFIPVPASMPHLISTNAFDGNYTNTLNGPVVYPMGPMPYGLAPPFPYNSVETTSDCTKVNAVANAAVSSIAVSNAIAGASQYQASALYGYMRIINGIKGQDFAQLMRAITPGGYSNIPLNASTNLAFQARGTSLYDIFSWTDGTKYLAVATDSHNNTLQNIRNYPGYPNCDLSAAFESASAQQANPPTTNFGGLIDNLAFNPGADPLDNPPNSNIPYPNNTTSNAATAVMPFIFACKESDTSLAWIMRIFGSWAEYNNSYIPNPTAKQKKSLDSLNRDPSKDPIVLLYNYYVSLNQTAEAARYKGETAASLYKKGVNGTYVLHEGRATGHHMQRMTIGTALNIRGVYLINDSSQNYQEGAPSWTNSIIPCVCSNYGFTWLPAWLGGNKTTFSPIEYAKAQVCCIFGGVGIYSNPVVVPSAPGYIYLPMAAFSAGNSNPLNQSQSSGMKDFLGAPPGGFSSYGWPNMPSPGGPFLSTNSNNSLDVLDHHPWYSVATVNAFEQLGSPFQYLYDINVLMNNGQFNAGGSLNQNLVGIMNEMLNAVHLMNPNRSMQDLVKVLSQNTLDVGQEYYVYDTNQGLVLSSTLPLTYGTPGTADSPNSVMQYYTTYSITGGWVRDDSKASTKESLLKSCIDTAANGALAGDAGLHDCPYRGIAPFPGNPNADGHIYAEDMAQWTPGTGAASSNYGDLNFFESVGPSMQFSSIN